MLHTGTAEIIGTNDPRLANALLVLEIPGEAAVALPFAGMCRTIGVYVRQAMAGEAKTTETGDA